MTTVVAEALSVSVSTVPLFDPVHEEAAEEASVDDAEVAVAVSGLLSAEAEAYEASEFSLLDADADGASVLEAEEADGADVSASDVVMAADEADEAAWLAPDPVADPAVSLMESWDIAED